MVCKSKSKTPCWRVWVRNPFAKSLKETLPYKPQHGAHMVELETPDVVTCGVKSGPSGWPGAGKREDAWRCFVEGLMSQMSLMYNFNKHICSCKTNKSKWKRTRLETWQATAPRLPPPPDHLVLQSWIPFTRDAVSDCQAVKSQISFPNKVATLAWNLTGAITLLLSPNKPPFQRLWAMDTWVCVISPSATEG